MPAFANAAAFDDPRSRLQAAGADLCASRAIVDAQGRVLAHARTGGMLDPKRLELAVGATLYHFGSASREPRAVAQGGWWLEKSEFEKMVRFANTHGIFIGLAMRLLCLVPPQWSDATQLVRARVARELLAWRGLANSVVTPVAGSGSPVRMPHHNDIAARRLHQLFIPGLVGLDPLNPVLAIENVYRLSANDGARGFLYL